MTTDILSSKMPADNKRGQNGDPTPSSTVPHAHGRTHNRDKKHGIELAPIPVVSPPMASVPSDPWQTRPVTSKQAVPTHSAQIEQAAARQNKR
jgi:hypothetical protein